MTDKIEELIKLLRPPMVLKAMLDVALKTSVADKEKIPEVRQFLNKAIGPDHLTEIMANVYSTHFDEEDIDVFLEFYKSPTGQKSLDKMPVVMNEVNQQFMAIVLKNIGDIFK